MSDRPRTHEKLPPLYGFLWIRLSTLARNEGYSIAIHGSMTCDLDLVAIPWVEDAGSPEDLLNLIRNDLGLSREWSIRGPEEKPHGRIAYSLHGTTSGGGYIDLSIMPRQEEA